MKRGHFHVSRRILIPFLLLNTYLFSQQLGYYIEEEVTFPPLMGIPGKTTLSKIWITDDKLRRNDLDRDQIIIIRSDLGKIWVVEPGDTSYREITHDVFQGMAMMMLMMFGIELDEEKGQPIIPDSLFLETSRTRKIGNWTCQEVVIRPGEETLFRKVGGNVTLWVTHNMGIERDLYSRMIRRMMGNLGEAYDIFFTQLEKMGGYPVLIKTKIRGSEYIQRLIKLEKRPIRDELFALPKNLRKQESFFDD